MAAHRTKGSGFGWRHVMTALLFWGTFCSYTMRVNLGITLVAMVNHTAIQARNTYLNQLDNHTNSNIVDPVIRCQKEARMNEINVSIANPEDERGSLLWDEELQGLILASFFYGYVVTQIPGGVYASRYGGKWVFGIGIASVAVLTLLTPLAASISPYCLIVVRVLEGFGEGVVYPTMHALFARWAPPAERTTLPAFAYSGCYIGTVFGFFVSGYLSASTIFGGWPSAFYTYGILGCIWFVLWAVLASDGPDNHPFISLQEKQFIIESQRHEGKRLYPSLKTMPCIKMLRCPALWVQIISHSSFNWGFYMLLTQLPAYLKNILGFDIAENGLVSALPYLCLGLVQACSGLLADFCRTKFNLTTGVVRKLFDGLGHFIPGLCFVLIIIAVECNSAAAIGLLTIAVASSGLCGAGFIVNHLDIAPRYSGILFGVSNTIASVTGIIAPNLVGYITKDNQTPEAWNICFSIAATLYFVSVVLFTLLASGEVQEWARGHKDDVIGEDGDYIHPETDIRRSLLDIAVLE